MDEHVPLPRHPITPTSRKGHSLQELRDELFAHLDRIQREEGYGWDVREWWFKVGEGI
ncbi:hypothetical protein [Microvirga sp. VF16]|uniref:hypothetical protein n=1 Tax=Microvirga sp. VF16 TaxID=2807101 RepID=UPI00193EB99A|nr:hypothetical protein [Microvirga sp. VF16]QRM28512.1 hypothetical protein JO965_20110 [Microvirga sp. VF16]